MPSARSPGGGLPKDAVDAARLAASEAASNAVIHAYRERAGDLRLIARVEQGELHLVIADEGRGLAPRTDSPGLGLGLPIMAHMSERFEIVSGPEGTEIHLAFRCRGPADRRRPARRRPARLAPRRA